MLFGVAWMIGIFKSKIHTVSVDNASTNDSVIFHLKTYAQRKKKLLCEGLFNVRCCAHILNLIAQDGIYEIKDIVEVIRDSIEYVWRSDARLLLFFKIVEQLNLPERKLVDDCRTRWNSTHEMLSTAVKFKDVFTRFAAKDPHYDDCPCHEDWEKVEKGETNLLMSIATVLDPRCKMKALEFCFPKLYSSEKVEREISFVRKSLHELYFEYALMYNDEVRGRVIDKYHASLTSETVQVLMCGGDWLRKHFGVKKKTKGASTSWMEHGQTENEEDENDEDSFEDYETDE
ncbi:Zinc finger BED domain-containing protein RICESLEEPER 2 [Sesamum angolense]|uniref:Zinc finger BED domain-containing protein RICESLEEPER 2 n=1 Tax=Sesamum angolense TaxID=2727404 RepID=A0AAE1WPW3_9LAMI|nr:Zinc finger BED domain-containing protein RICESLEEPER 2 [Sesamum angolense]